MYPDEIEGVIFLDGTQLDESTEIEGVPSHFEMMRDMILCNLGFYRLAASHYIRPLVGDRSEEDQAMSYALCVRSGCNHAIAYETENVNENARAAFDSIVTNDVPKVYICSSWGMTREEEYTENLNWINEQNQKAGLPEIPYNPTIPELEIEQSKTMRETVLQPYLDKIGNCELVLLAGDHFIFDQKPDGCAEIISDFLDKLKGE